jgi:hypothetical protein
VAQFSALNVPRCNDASRTCAGDTIARRAAVPSQRPTTGDERRSAKQLGVTTLLVLPLQHPIHFAEECTLVGFSRRSRLVYDLDPLKR